jgi:hypothetical protein
MDKKFMKQLGSIEFPVQFITEEFKRSHLSSILGIETHQLEIESVAFI